MSARRTIGTKRNEQFYADNVRPYEMDLLLADGWRHFGTHFYRYSLGVHKAEIQLVVPLRVRVADFILSQSQRRILRKNEDLRTVIRPVEITAEKQELFERHKMRFEEGVPDSVYDFVSAEPATVPCRTNEVCLYDGDRLLGLTFLDEGEKAASAVYAMFEPAESARSLGILMILREIEDCRNTGREYFYPGYAYSGPSFYDYKKRFSALEEYDWMGNWTDYKPETAFE
jgi:arginyl-tRNA--protein-N-Asp/Glu arginylyltransferase